MPQLIFSSAATSTAQAPGSKTDREGADWACDIPGTASDTAKQIVNVLKVEVPGLDRRRGGETGDNLRIGNADA